MILTNHFKWGLFASFIFNSLICLFCYVFCWCTLTKYLVENIFLEKDNVNAIKKMQPFSREIFYIMNETHLDFMVSFMYTYRVTVNCIWLPHSKTQFHIWMFNSLPIENQRYIVYLSKQQHHHMIMLSLKIKYV